MQSANAGVRMVHAGTVPGARFVGTASTNLKIITSYMRLPFVRRCHNGMHLQKAKQPKRFSTVHHGKHRVRQTKPETVHVKGADQTRFGKWNVMVFLVGRGQAAQAFEELMKVAQALLRMVALQCEVQTAERIRRGLQMYSVYSRLWGEEAARALLNSFRRMLVARGRHFLLSAVCFSQYDWETNKISDEYLKSSVRDIDNVEELCKATVICGDCGKRQVIDQQMNNIDYCMCSGQLGYTDTSRIYDSWEPFIERSHHIVWRKKHEIHQHLFAYKVYGVYDDVCLSAFMEVQLNSHFRTEWDDTALQLRVLDSHKDSNSELIYWLVKYPHFFADRDYIYKRRFTWNEEKQEAVIVNEAIAPDHIPEEKGIHRVNEYWSRMVIRAKKNASEPGLEYTLTYFDNPGTSLPQWLTNFIAVTGFPSFLQKVHKAAVSLQKIHEEGQDVYVTIPEELRYPKRPKVEPPVLEKPAVLEIMPKEEEVISETITETPLISSPAKIEVPAIEDVERLLSDVEEEVSPESMGSGDNIVEVLGEPRSISDEPEIIRISSELNDVSGKLNSSSVVDDAITGESHQVEDDVKCETPVASSEEVAGNVESNTSLTEEITSDIEGKSNLPDMLKSVSDGDEELASEISNNEKVYEEALASKIIDKSLSVKLGGKKVEVDILEGMEVVAPDLDKQTALSRNVEMLTQKAIEELESRTMLVEKLEKLKNCLKLFQKHANKRKEDSIKKMKEMEKRGHYDNLDDQTRKHLENLFDAMREVLQADKEMRTGKGLLKPQGTGSKWESWEETQDTESSLQPESLLTKLRTLSRDHRDPQTTSQRKNSDENDSHKVKRKSKSPDDPPPPPSSESPPPFVKETGPSSETGDHKESNSNGGSEVETYNGIENIEGVSATDLNGSTWSSWVPIPSLTSLWKSKGELETLSQNSIEGETVERSLKENVPLSEAQVTTSVTDQVRYVVGLGWMFRANTENQSLDGKIEEKTLHESINDPDKGEVYSWYWYPVNGAYRFYMWAFRSSKENA